MGRRYGISLVLVLALGTTGCSSSGGSTTQSAATSAGPFKCKWSSESRQMGKGGPKCRSNLVGKGVERMRP